MAICADCTAPIGLPEPCTLVLPDGSAATLRLLAADDVDALGTFFVELGEETRRLYAPHAFDRETAASLCAGPKPEEAWRFVLVASTPVPGRILAYFIIKLGGYASDAQRYAARGLHLDEATTCSLAPSVADDQQSRGIGSTVLGSILAAMATRGYRTMVLQGGVRALNPRAIRFYEKNGFVRVGDFRVRDLDNHDMMLDLTRVVPG